MLIFAVYSLNYWIAERTEYKQKEALLREALKMFESDDEIIVVQNVIYEDEMIIIYSTVENEN